MKCPGCGSNLTIDDEKCQFCGQANPFAVKHRKEMKRFTNEFNKTKDEVLSESRKVNHRVAKITLIAVMVALNLLMMFVNVNFDEFERFFVGRKIEANYKEHKEQLDKYEKEQNFIAFSEYYMEHRLHLSDKLREYGRVYDVCSSYGFLFYYVMQVQTQQEVYTSRDEQMEYISDNIESIYNMYKPREYSYEDQYQPQHQECMNAIKEQAEGLIQTYFNLTDEEMASFESMSNARRQILMEEGLLRNE